MWDERVQWQASNTKESSWQEIGAQLYLYTYAHPLLEAAGADLQGMHLDLNALPAPAPGPHSGAGGGTAQRALQQHLAAKGPAAAVVLQWHRTAQ